MKKNLSMSLLAISTILVFSGCGPKSSIISSSCDINYQNSEILISESKPIAYAYFDEDGKLIEISNNPEISNEDDHREAVYITEKGFYPKNYYEGEIYCKKENWFAKYSDSHCYSIFSKTNMADAVIRNSVIAVGSIGVATLGGANYTMKNFNYPKFYKVVTESGLIQKRKELLSKKPQTVFPVEEE